MQDDYKYLQRIINNLNLWKLCYCGKLFTNNLYLCRVANMNA